PCGLLVRPVRLGDGVRGQVRHRSGTPRPGAPSQVAQPPAGPHGRDLQRRRVPRQGTRAERARGYDPPGPEEALIPMAYIHSPPIVKAVAHARPTYLFSALVAALTYLII